MERVGSSKIGGSILHSRFPRNEQTLRDWRRPDPLRRFRRPRHSHDILHRHRTRPGPCALRPCPDTCADWSPRPRPPEPLGAPDTPGTNVPHNDPTVGATATMPLDDTERLGDLLDSRLGEKVAELGDLLRGLDVGVLINNVGASYPYACYFHEVDEALALNLIRFNVEAVTRVTHAVLHSMLERGRGATVNIGSVVSAIMLSDSLYTVCVATKADQKQQEQPVVSQLKENNVTATILNHNHWAPWMEVVWHLITQPRRLNPVREVVVGCRKNRELRMLSEENSMLLDTVISIVDDSSGTDGIASSKRGRLIKLSYTGVLYSWRLAGRPC